MAAAFVLGNGVSRKGLDLAHIQQYGPIYGCNALFREFIPNVLVSTDKPIAMHIESLGYPKQNKFYTRKPTPESGSLPIPKPYYGFSSGPVAVALAAQEQHRRIYMLGFDLGPADNNKFNNLYAGTEFYKPVGSNPTYTGNWVKQLKHICQEFPETRFIRVCGNTTARLPDLDSIKNLDHLSLERFTERINNQKDL